jgi:hypothetical protein
MRIEQRITTALNREVTRRKLLDIAVFGAADLALGMAARDGIKAIQAGNSAQNANNSASLVGQKDAAKSNLYYTNVGPGLRTPVLRTTTPQATPIPISQERQQEINRERAEFLYKADIQEKNYYKHVVLTAFWSTVGLIIGLPRYLRKDN